MRRISRGICEKPVRHSEWLATLRIYLNSSCVTPHLTHPHTHFSSFPRHCLPLALSQDICNCSGANMFIFDDSLLPILMG